MAWFGWVVVALVFVLSFFVGKGLSLKKAAPAPKAKPVAVDPQLAAEHLAGALRCRNLWPRNGRQRKHQRIRKAASAS